MEKRKKIILLIVTLLMIAIVGVVYIKKNKTTNSGITNKPNVEDITQKDEDETNIYDSVDAIDETEELKKEPRVKYDESIEYEKILPEENIEVSNNWKDFELGINGNTISFPCDIKTFIETSGLSINDADKQINIKPDGLKKINVYRDEQQVCTIICKNINNNKEILENCQVIGLEQSCYNGPIAPENVFVFPGSLHIGDPSDTLNLIEKVGDYYDVYDEYDIYLEDVANGIQHVDEDYAKYTYRDANDELEKSKMEVVGSNSVIIQLTIYNDIY